MDGALKRFRVMAWIVGTLLIVLVFVAVPLRYLFDRPTLEEIVGPLHGFLYIVYVLFAFNLAVKARWSFTRTVLLLLAGIVPVMTFVAEHKATGWVRANPEPAVSARS